MIYFKQFKKIIEEKNIKLNFLEELAVELNIGGGNGKKIRRSCGRGNCPKGSEKTEYFCLECLLIIGEEANKAHICEYHWQTNKCNCNWSLRFEPEQFLALIARYHKNREEDEKEEY